MCSREHTYFPARTTDTVMAADNPDRGKQRVINMRRWEMKRAALIAILCLAGVAGCSNPFPEDASLYTVTRGEAPEKGVEVEFPEEDVVSDDTPSDSALVGSGDGCALVPGAGASGVGALGLLLWLAPIAYLRLRRRGAGRRFTRFMLIVLALAIAPAMICGCDDGSSGLSGGGVVDPEPEPAPVPNPEPAPTPNPEPAPAPTDEETITHVTISAADTGKINYWQERLVQIDWSLTDVAGGYIAVMKGTNFLSSFYTSGLMHLGTKAKRESGSQKIAEDLLADPLEKFDQLSSILIDKINKDDDGHPFSFCLEYSNNLSASCYEDIGTCNGDLVRVFFPLRPDETSRTGAWVFPIRNEIDMFPVAYRDTEGVIHQMVVEIKKSPSNVVVQSGGARMKIKRVRRTL